MKRDLKVLCYADYRLLGSSRNPEKKGDKLFLWAF